MNAVSSQFNDTHRTGRGRAFSMIELLVVIAIIAVLAGILLVALKGVRERALATQTRATMQEFSKACDSFEIEHGSYPGIIPEGLLAPDGNHKLSGTENALLHMMGGAVRGDHPDYQTSFPPPDWTEIVVDDNTPLGQIKVNLSLIGNGPEINGTPYSPYFTPKGDELVAIKGQANEPGQTPETFQLPDLVDAWGQPIIYLRRSRPIGPLVGEPNDEVKPQFMLGPMRSYINADILGELGQSQFRPGKGSILKLAADESEVNALLAQIIRHPSFGESDDSINGTARGAYVLISAGKDGVYFSVADGPGTPLSPIFGGGPDSLDFDNFMELGPKVIDEFDDLRLFGGG
ncbi:MAG: type II secretion system protein [Phycisphaerales bacterium]